MGCNFTLYFNQFTKLFQHFLVLKTQSQNRNLRDSQMKNLSFLIQQNKSLAPKLVWMNNSRIRLEFKGSCLEQEDKHLSLQKM